MNVLIYNENFYPSIGGVETFVFNLAKGLEEIGVEVNLITQTCESETGDNHYPFGVFRLPSRSVINKLIEESDLIHINSFDPYLFFVSKFKGKKIVSTIHDYTLICPKGTKFKLKTSCDHPADPVRCYLCLKESGIKKPLRKLFRPLIKRAVSILSDLNVVPNTYSYKRLGCFNSTIINHGIDTSLFSPANQLNIENNVITYIGRLIPDKGVDILLNALEICASKITTFKLNIVGSGPELDNIKKIAEKAGIIRNIEFHGALQAEQIADIIRSSSMVIVPSVWDELFGLTAIEALSCGVPVVTSDSGGLTEIPERVSLHYPKKDARRLADIIQRLVTRQIDTDSLTRLGRNLVLEKYDYLNMAKEYLKLYLKVIRSYHNKNLITNFVSKIIPPLTRRNLHVFMVDRGWPVRYKTGTSGIYQLGYKGYVGEASVFELSGRIQFEFMVKMGLRPDDVMCDIGCGSLRGGKHFIKYLNPGNYLAIEGEKLLVDLSLKYEIDPETIKLKKPEFVYSCDFEFSKFSKSPNYAISVSLFSHLNEHDIVKCLVNLASIIKDECQFYASFNETTSTVANYRKSHSHLGFYYTIEELKSFGDKSGWNSEYIGEWGSIAGQTMMKFTLNRNTKR